LQKKCGNVSKTRFGKKKQIMSMPASVVYGAQMAAVATVPMTKGLVVVVGATFVGTTVLSVALAASVGALIWTAARGRV
jgi:hypothetical protein